MEITTKNNQKKWFKSKLNHYFIITIIFTNLTAFFPPIIKIFMMIIIQSSLIPRGVEYSPNLSDSQDVWFGDLNLCHLLASLPCLLHLLLCRSWDNEKMVKLAKDFNIFIMSTFTSWDDGDNCSMATSKGCANQGWAGMIFWIQDDSAYSRKLETGIQNCIPNYWKLKCAIPGNQREWEFH